METSLTQFGITLMPKRRKDMKAQWSLFQNHFIIGQNRRQIETSFSILTEIMGLDQVKARNLEGFMIKAYAAVIGLIFHITTRPLAA